MIENNNLIKTVKANVDGRDFIIGDLHGCFDELINLLNFVKFNKNKDRLFSTGDLIDRGPKSKECMELLNTNWFFPILGNHEDLLINKLKLIEDGEDQELTKEEKETIEIYEPYMEKILNMPIIYEINHLIHNKIFIVHAEILPEHLFDIENENSNQEYQRYLNSMKKYDFSTQLLNFFEKCKNENLENNLKQKLIWSRKNATNFYKEHKDKIENSDFSFLLNESLDQNIKIFCGHNVVPFPMKIGQQYYIDTGSALGYSSKEVNSFLFTQFGHEFFTLSLVDLTTGLCYGCISSSNNKNYKRGQILKLQNTIF